MSVNNSCNYWVLMAECDNFFVKNLAALLKQGRFSQAVLSIEPKGLDLGA